MPDLNNFLASMANSNEFSNLMSGLTDSIQQQVNNNPNNNKNEEINNNNRQEEEDDDDDDDEDDEFDELLYNLLTNEKEEPFPNILSRIDESLSNINKNFERQNNTLEKICEQLINK